MGSFWTDDRTDRAVQLDRAGFSRAEIARILGTSRSAVCGLLYRQVNHLPVFTLERDAFLRRRAAAGADVLEIARALSLLVGRAVSTSAVRRRLRELHLSAPRPRVAPAKPKPVPKPRATLSKPPSDIAALADAFLPLPGAVPVPFLDRPAFGCRWPVEMPTAGPPPLGGFVCALSGGGQCYCPTHYLIARYGLARRELRRAA